MGKILWIDNNPSRYALLHGFAEQSGDLVFFANGRAQINHYMKHFGDYNFSLFLLDHDMPEINGVQVVERYTFPEDRPIVIVSLNAPKAQEMNDILHQKGHRKVYVVPAMPDTNFEQVLSLIHDRDAKDALSSWLGELGVK